MTAHLQSEAEALRAWRIRERQTARIESVLERAPDDLLGDWFAWFVGVYMQLSGIAP